MSKSTLSPIHQKIIDINAKITKEQEALENAGSSATRAAAKKRLARAWASLEVAQEELVKEEKAAEKKAGATTKKALAEEAAAKKETKRTTKAAEKSAPATPPAPSAPEVTMTEEELIEQVTMELEQRPDWKKLGVAGRKDAVYREVQNRKVTSFQELRSTKGSSKEKKEKKEKTVKPAGERKSRSNLSSDTKITVLPGAQNPHREGSLAHGWFEDMCNSKTVAEYAEKSYNIGYLSHWAKLGLIKLG